MIIHDYPLSWYIKKLQSSDYFSTGRYGDGSWIAIGGERVGDLNSEGTQYTPELCKALRESLKYEADNYYFSTTEWFNTIPWYKKLFSSLTSQEFIECNTPWDVQSRTGGLLPFIKQIQEMKTCIISNVNLRRLEFLHYDGFIEVSYPNCFPEINSVIDQAEKFGGDDCVYLVSAGQPAPLITQRIHEMFPDVFALDVGSIWDAFVGIGAQRGWRQELYDDDRQYQLWRGLYKEVL